MKLFQLLFTLFWSALCVYLAIFIYSTEDIRIKIPKSQSKLKDLEVIFVPLENLMKAPQSLPQDHPVLINKIRHDYLLPPSNLQYKLDGNTDDPSKGQSTEIKELLQEKRDGFFIECGALDGETRSNSLVFEKVYGWSGVLIEGDPSNFELVSAKNRKAWTVPACLSIHPFPSMEIFEQNYNIGKIKMNEQGENIKTKSHVIKVQCLPLYSILLALNQTSVDYFSLDVEGHELDVLRTIPWDKVNITTLSVEFIHGKEGKNNLKSFMESNGYVTYTEVKHPKNLANDFIFYHPKLLGRKPEMNIQPQT